MKRVLIVRLDAIGDYVLWRNCLRFVRRCDKYKDAHVTVLGNPAWRNLAETFDGDCADEWIWVKDRGALFRKGYENLLPYGIWHRRVAAAQDALRAKLSAYRFDEVISPVAFPDVLLDELVAGIAPVTISVANGSRARATEFSRFLDPGEEPFVFFRNKAIAEELAEEPCGARLELKVGEVPPRTKRILFFTGASHWTRRWPRCRWRELASLLPSGYEVAEAPQGGSLADFAKFVASCAAVVSNDTMALHVAAALDVPAVGIANGVSGRGSFWPYPEALGKRVVVCVPAKVPQVNVPLLGSRLAQYLALSSVSAREVAGAVAEVLK